MPLRQTWAQYNAPGIHFEDHQAPLLAVDVCCAREWRDRDDTRIHINLRPQPFYGDPEIARFVVLFGNPGAVQSDYADRDDPALATHWRMHQEALHGAQHGFFPLREQRVGAGRYWCSRFRRLAGEVFPDLKGDEALNELSCLVAVVDASAYPSAKKPADNWVDHLPTSQAAFAFAHGKLLDRVRRGEALVFVWRRHDFWEIAAEPDPHDPDGCGGVMVRTPKHAFLQNFKAAERLRIMGFLKKFG